jgi:hypothetical protein
MLTEAMSRNEGVGIGVAQWAVALSENGFGHYEDALVVAEQAAEQREEVASRKWALVELIEAAARSGSDAGTDALRALTVMTQASGTDWALGLEARSRALWTKVRMQNLSTVRRSSGSAERGYAPSSHAPTSSTANGFAASGGGSTLGSSFARRTDCSSRWASKRSCSAQHASCVPLARRLANDEGSRQAATSRHRRRRSPTSPAKGSRIARSPVASS